MGVLGSGDKIEPADELLQGDALIRANFGMDPGKLSEEKWAILFCQAVWLENTRLKNQAELLTALFGEKR